MQEELLHSNSQDSQAAIEINPKLKKRDLQVLYLGS